MSWNREFVLKKYSNLTLFTPKLPLLCAGGGVMKFIISCLLTHRCYKPNLVKIGPGVLDKKTLTHDAQRTKDDGRQPIEISHMSDSGDLKTTLNTKIAWELWTHTKTK